MHTAIMYCCIPLTSQPGGLLFCTMGTYCHLFVNLNCSFSADNALQGNSVTPGRKSWHYAHSTRGSITVPIPEFHRVQKLLSDYWIMTAENGSFLRQQQAHCPMTHRWSSGFQFLGNTKAVNNGPGESGVSSLYIPEISKRGKTVTFTGNSKLPKS